MTPRMEELHLKETFLPKSPMGKALNYAHSEWKAWQVYLTTELWKSTII
jgi:hypothetical protein